MPPQEPVRVRVCVCMHACIRARVGVRMGVRVRLRACVCLGPRAGDAEAVEGDARAPGQPDGRERGGRARHARPCRRQVVLAVRRRAAASRAGAHLGGGTEAPV